MKLARSAYAVCNCCTASSSGAQVALVHSAGVANKTTSGFWPESSASAMLIECSAHAGVLLQMCEVSPLTSRSVGDAERGAGSSYPGALNFGRTSKLIRATRGASPVPGSSVTWTPHGPVSGNVAGVTQTPLLAPPTDRKSAVASARFSAEPDASTLKNSTPTVPPVTG